MTEQSLNPPAEMLILVPKKVQKARFIGQKLAVLTAELAIFNAHLCLIDEDPSDARVTFSLSERLSWPPNTKHIHTYTNVTPTLLNTITHAIVFTDGQSLTGELQQLNQLAIPQRIINVPITRLINMKRETQYQNKADDDRYQYIGRGSLYGNPYSHLNFNHDEPLERATSIEHYAYDFARDLLPRFNKAEIHHLAGKTLGCFCLPLPCHGEVLMNYLNQLDDET